MFTLLMVLLGQFVFALIVIFILKRLLDRELINAAIEKFESCKISSETKEIVVFSASALNDQFKYQIESIHKRKFVQANLDFRQNLDLKGGIVIMLGDLILDFSLLSRLQNFWS